MSSDPHPAKSGPKQVASNELATYGVLAFLLLVVLTAAILTPDYLNYRYRIAALNAHASKTTVKATPANAASSQSLAASASSSSQDTKTVTDTDPTQNANNNKGTLDQGAALNAGSQSDVTREHEGKTDIVLTNADIFETYGKLVTLLLGFVAVIGVIAGYFVRKSVRELNDDIRSDITREIGFFEREKKVILDEASRIEANSKATCQRVEALETEIHKNLELLKRNLDLLNASVSSDSAKKGPSRSIDDDAQALDAAVESARKQVK